MPDSAPKANPLGVDKIGPLLKRFAVPSIVAMLVNALYNIVDQIFIGQGVGVLGNAATNVAFPLTTISLAIALLVAQGTASKQNLELGAGNRKTAEKSVANGILMAVVFGVALMVVGLVFFRPMLRFFGATADNMPYAEEYVRIILLGMPFVMISTGINATIRADGSPTYAMVSMFIGAVINTILDPIFIFVFEWGMAGAAWATITGQIISSMIVMRYVRRYRHISLTKPDFKPDFALMKAIMALGIASFVNQISMAIVQIILNQSLVHYGGMSRYGQDIPLACAGIVAKVSMIFMAIIIGVAQGTQPILSFNYGAKKYARVKEVYLKAAGVASSVAILAFVIFQFFPQYIIRLFGDGSPEYFEFATRLFRINQMMIFINGIQPLTGTFFTSIGKAVRGTFVSMTRQLLFLMPLILILPRFFGIDGILFAAPIADLAAFIAAVLLVRIEFNKMTALEQAKLQNAS